MTRIPVMIDNNYVNYYTNFIPLNNNIIKTTKYIVFKNLRVTDFYLAPKTPIVPYLLFMI